MSKKRIIFVYIIFIFIIKKSNFQNQKNKFSTHDKNKKRILDNKCPKGFYLNGEECFQCYENCIECNGLKCIECEKGYFVNEMNCFQCNINCLACDGIHCNECIKGYYPCNMDCYKCYENCLDCDGIQCNECIAGYYANNMDCYKCYENCLECNSTECLLCKEGYYPFKMSCFSISKTACNNEFGFYMLKNDYIKIKSDPEYLFICLTKTDIGTGFFVNSEEENEQIFYFWDSCSTNCLECNGLFEDNCSECDGINYFKLYEDKDELNNFKCYKKNEKLNYFIYIEDNEKYLRKCSDNCLECISYSKDKCTSCDNKNYFIKYEDIPYISNGIQCFSQIELPNYYLYMNQYFKECIGVCSTNECDKSCTNCLVNDKYECLSCNMKDNYYPLSIGYNEKNSSFKCYLKNNYPHYFLNETDKTLVECSKTCKSCVTNSTYCTSCAENAYYAQGFNDLKCYFEKPDINWVFNNKTKEWEKCNERCKTCFKQTNSENDQQCTLCNSTKGFYPYQRDIEVWNGGNNKYKITGFNCYKREEIFENYYFDNLNSSWVKCSKSCLKCESNPDNCLICNKNNEYYNIKNYKNGSCFKNPLPGYILDSEQEFNKCYKTCKFCQTTSNSFFYMQCKECDEINYTLAKNSYEKSYCIPKDNSNSLYLIDQLKWYITGYNSSEHYKIYDYEVFNDIKYENFDFNLTYKCPKEKPYIIYPTRQCVSKCSNPDDLIEYGLFFYNKSLYFYNNICYDECPYGSYADNKTMTCIEENKYIYENLILRKQFYLYYQTNVDIYLAKSANNTIFEIQSSEFTNYFYNYSTNESWKYQQNMPIFNFDECISKLENKFNYTKEEIHIGIFQNNDLAKENPNSLLLSAVNSTSYKIFLSNGSLINFSICNGLNVNVKKPLNVSLIENYKESLELLSKYNFSIFDEENKILTDMCIPLELNGKDISVFSRENRLKSKIKLCDDNCKFLGVDYEKNYSLCECKMVDEYDKEIGVEDFLKNNVPIIEKTAILKDKSNIIIFKCLSKTKFDGKNYIFYISLILIISHLILLFLFFYAFYKDIEEKIKTKFMKDNKLNGNINNEENNNTERNNEDSNKQQRLNLLNVGNKINVNKTINYKIKENDTISIFNENYNPNIDDKDSNSNKNIIAVHSRKKILSRSVQIVNDTNKNICTKNIIKEKKIKYCSIFRNILYNNLFEKFSFVKNLFYEYIILSSQILLFLLQSFLFWTGLLNTEEYITKRFDEKNTIGFIYILTNEFNKYFWTSILIVISFKTLKFFFNGIKSIKPDDLKNTLIENFMLRQKIKIIFIEIIISILHIFFGIFLYIFGNIYPNNKNLLLISALISILINLIIIFICLILGSFVMSLPFLFKCFNCISDITDEIGNFILNL